MTRRWRVKSANRPAGRQVSAKLTDEGCFVSCPARRRRPHIPAASAATYPLRCFAPQWARFDNRHSTSAPTPTLTAVSGSGASGTSDPPNRQCYPPHFMRECIPPNLHDPQRAKGSLDRRSKWFSLVPFFLQKKKVTRAGARNAPSRARRRSTCLSPRQGSLET